MWKNLWMYSDISARISGWHHGVYFIFILMWEDEISDISRWREWELQATCVRDGKSCDRMPGSFPSSAKWIHLNGLVLVAVLSSSAAHLHVALHKMFFVITGESQLSRARKDNVKQKGEQHPHRHPQKCQQIECNSF